MKNESSCDRRLSHNLNTVYLISPTKTLNICLYQVSTKPTAKFKQRVHPLITNYIPPKQTNSNYKRTSADRYLTLALEDGCCLHGDCEDVPDVHAEMGHPTDGAAVGASR